MQGDTVGTVNLDRIKAELFTLSESERAELAFELIRSLGMPAEVGVEEAWQQEVAKRIANIDAGTASFVSREEFRQRIGDRLGRG